MRRRLLLLAAPAALSACGFELRRAPDFAFRTIAMPLVGSSVTIELARTLRGNGIQVVSTNGPTTGVDAILEPLADTREKVVVGLNASGQVREFQLRMVYRFRVKTPQGRELIPSAEITQQRDISFNESAVLAKEAEESLLYRDMQSDLVQQVMRRLSAVKSL